MASYFDQKKALLLPLDEPDDGYCTCCEQGCTDSGEFEPEGFKPIPGPRPRLSDSFYCNLLYRLAKL